MNVDITIRGNHACRHHPTEKTMHVDMHHPTVDSIHADITVHLCRGHQQCMQTSPYRGDHRCNIAQHGKPSMQIHVSPQCNCKDHACRHHPIEETMHADITLMQGSFMQT